MTPDEPEPPGTPRSSEDHAKSRAELQAEVRKTQKKERKYQHRWRRRGLYALSLIVVLAALGAGGLYVYANYRFNQIKKVHAKHLVRTAPVGNQQPLTLLLVGSDSRAFVDNATQVKAFGTESTAGGQRSDVTMAVRIDPVTKTVVTLALELGKHGVTVNAILPGAIKTGMTAGSFVNQDVAAVWAKKSVLRRLGEPIDVARVALFLASDDAAFVTGIDFLVDGGAASF